MLVNSVTEDELRNVKFISYDGEYPNLCRGTLILRIGNEYATFGSISNGAQHQSFWESGGDTYFADGRGCASSGEWIIDVSELPERFRKYAGEIDRVFNTNVPHGCCGGCL